MADRKYHYENQYLKPLAEQKLRESAERKCLKCGRIFNSVSKVNRICNCCKDSFKCLTPMLSEETYYELI